MQYLRRIPYYATVALLIYMPFHIFLSQSLSLLTGGLELWKIAKDLFLAAAVVFTICLVFREKQGRRPFWVLTGLTAAYGLLHLLVWALHPDIYSRSAELGILMNLRLPVFAILAYGAYLLAPAQFVFSSIIKIVLGVSTVVVVLGLLQYVLPKDILTHVGYSLERGVRPAFFIDDNPAFPRIMSTLREPNALAAYLLVPIALLTGLLAQAKHTKRRIGLGLLIAAHVVTLYLTGSRSALLALLVIVGFVLVASYRMHVMQTIKRWWLLALVAVCLIVAGTYSLRNEPHIQGLVSHSTPDVSQANDLDSNDYHWIFFKRGLDGAVAQPGGHGPGTAGLASIQNPAGSFLTENYYVQVAYETGLAGLLLFLAINVWLYRRLYRQRNYLGYALLASFWGYVVMNMLLHTWGNEAVAAQWWLLAGIACMSHDANKLTS